MSRVIRLTEHRPTQLPDDSLTVAQAERLTRFAKYIEIQPPFPGANSWSLMSKGYVGAIRLDGECYIVIEPKVPVSNLAKMIQVVFDLPVDFFAGEVRVQSVSDLYDQIASRAAHLVLAIARQGFHHEHVSVSRELGAVRGRLDIQRMFGRPPRSSVPCHISERTPDVWQNRTLLAGLGAALDSGICGRSTHALLREAYSRLAGEVSQVGSGQFPVEYSYTRLTERYRPSHQLCRLLMAGRSPVAERGETPTVPFLLNMPRLFEQYVARWLGPVLGPMGFEVAEQVRHRVGSPIAVEFYIDLVVRDVRTKRAVMVMDTKYKNVNTPISSDLAQVAYYALLEVCPSAGLIAPEGSAVKWHASTGGVRTFMAGFDLGGDLDAAGAQFVAAIAPELERIKAA